MKKIITFILFVSLLLGGAVHAIEGDAANGAGEINHQENQSEVSGEELQNQEIIEEDIQILDDELVSEETQNAKALSSIETVEDLLDAITNVTEDMTIVLSNSFVSGNIEIPMPSVNVTIDGSNIEWNNGIVIIVGNNSGRIVFQDIVFDGSSINERIFKNHATQGKVVLNDVTFKNGKEGAVEINNEGPVLTEFNRVLFDTNTSTSGASAIHLNPKSVIGSNVDINYSTFINNESKSYNGALGAAIGGSKFIGNININNTVFRNNTNNSSGSGSLPIGGGGGAIELQYLLGHVHINESIFDANSTNGENSNVEKSNNGGAIFVLDGRDKATFTIENSTFSNNIAYNYGGAIFFQGTGNPGLTTQITNSTFFNNEAYGLSTELHGGNSYAGGAIQYFKNGGSAKMTNNILSSTFVGNSSGHKNGSGELRGGAIALNGAGIFAMAAVTRNNSLFLDNTVFKDGVINDASNYKDISNYTTVQGSADANNKVNIINIQKGLDHLHSIDEILEHEVPFLANNGTNKMAGVNKEPVQTIMIRPGGLADNTFNSSSAVNLPLYDQRGFPRGKDQGAVNTFYISYDANGGYYEPINPDEVINDSYKYTEKDAEGKYVKQYYLGTDETKNDVFNPCPGYKHPDFNLYPNSELPVYCTGNDDENLKITHPNDERFIGWSTDKEATVPDAELDFKDITNMKDETFEIYAVWFIRVNFDANGGYFGDEKDAILEADTFINKETNLGTPISPKREGHTLIGWYTDKELTQEWNFSDPITKTMTLYAKWEKGYTITINYEDMDGNEVLDSVGKPIEVIVETGALNSKYTLDIKSIDNHYFNGVMINGEITDALEVVFGSTGEDNIDVIIRYKENPKISIKYFDSKGSPLKSDLVIQESPGYKHELVFEEFDGYFVQSYTILEKDTYFPRKRFYKIFLV